MAFARKETDSYRDSGLAQSKGGSGGIRRGGRCDCFSVYARSSSFSPERMDGKPKTHRTSESPSFLLVVSWVPQRKTETKLVFVQRCSSDGGCSFDWQLFAEWSGSQPCSINGGAELGLGVLGGAGFTFWNMLSRREGKWHRCRVKRKEINYDGGVDGDDGTCTSSLESVYFKDSQIPGHQFGPIYWWWAPSGMGNQVNVSYYPDLLEKSPQIYMKHFQKMEQTIKSMWKNKSIITITVFSLLFLMAWKHQRFNF